MLRCVAKNAVRVTLERGQIVERGRFFGSVFLLDAFHRSRLTSAGVGKLHRGSFVLEFFRHGRYAAAIKLHRVKRLCAERADLRLTLHQQRQRWGENTPDIQRAMVKHRKEPCGVDPHQPIRLGAAERRLMQTVIVAARTEVLESTADRIILHGRNPEPLHRLCAASHAVDGTEDQLALAPSVAGIDDAAYILTVQEGFQNLKLRPLIAADFPAPRKRHDGKIIIAPLGVGFVIGFSAG